jgi:threonine dehydrogenase-like Zn-dependent dehydrogenase
MNKAQTMRTGQASVKRYMPHLLEHVRAGRISPKKIFTHVLPLEDAPRGPSALPYCPSGSLRPTAGLPTAIRITRPRTGC